MNEQQPDFSDEQLASIFDVSIEVIAAWDADRVGPDFFEVQTPDGVKRFYSVEAVRRFCLKHRQTGDATATNSAIANARIAPLVGGGVITPANE